MMKSFPLVFFVLLFNSSAVRAQLNFDLGPKGYVTLSFEATSHFIIMDVKLGNVLPLKFIFDTGSEHTLLFKKEYADLLGVQYDRRIPLMGSDLSQEVFGYIARGVDLRIAGSYAVRTDILVLEQDYLNLEGSTGVKIDGIIGANIFKYFILAVNNRRNKIQLHSAERYKPPNSFREVPVTIYKNKPYVDGITSMSGDRMEVRLLLDTGAGLPLLIYTNTADHLRLPEKTIRGTLGSGLGGDLEGYIGRLENFSFGGYEFFDVLSSFQEVEIDSITRLGLERHGILGNSVLGRFNYAIDYPHEQLYMKSRGRLKRKFSFDKSGIQLAATGHNLKDYIIQRVLDNSPAQDEGLRKGDVIKKIEGIPTGFFSLSALNNILSSRVGRVVKLHIDRGDKRLKKRIKLRKII